MAKPAFSAALLLLLLAAVASPLAAQPSEAFDILVTAATFDTDLGRFGTVIAAGDVNGDGIDDSLAIYGPDEDASGLRPGAVVTLSGSGAHGICCASSLTGSGDQRYGEGLAFGNFDGAGGDELVVGRPGSFVNLAAEAGDLIVLKSSPGGWALDSTWSQFTSGVADHPAADDGFGRVLAVGDFDDDGIDDLAIGVPREDDGALSDAGVLHVLYGSAGTGLTATGSGYFEAGTTGVPGDPEAFALFGHALAAADLDCDGIDDLAVAVPRAAVGAEPDAGAVVVLKGSLAGLTATGAIRITQADFVEQYPGGLFGLSLAAGRTDLGIDGCATLMIGAPSLDVLGEESAGAVFRWRHGVILETWIQEELGWDSEPNDSFGISLTIADFDGDGRGDLAIGSHAETMPGGTTTGIVYVVGHNGSPSFDLFGSESIFLGPGIEAMDTEPQTGWTFGSFGQALAAPDLDGDGYADLAVGMPTSSTGALWNGAVELFFSALFAEDFEGDDLAEWSFFIE